jgi:hypothetical protein
VTGNLFLHSEILGEKLGTKPGLILHEQLLK